MTAQYIFFELLLDQIAFHSKVQVVNINLNDTLRMKERKNCKSLTSLIIKNTRSGKTLSTFYTLCTHFSLLISKSPLEKTKNYMKFVKLPSVISTMRVENTKTIRSWLLCGFEMENFVLIFQWFKTITNLFAMRTWLWAIRWNLLES